MTDLILMDKRILFLAWEAGEVSWKVIQKGLTSAMSSVIDNWNVNILHVSSTKVL